MKPRSSLPEACKRHRCPTNYLSMSLGLNRGMVRRRLRVAPVGEIRRRWAATICFEELNQGVGGGDCSDADEVEWITSTAEALREHADPLHGLRPMSRLWAQSDDEYISTSPSFCKLDVSLFQYLGLRA
jgi:hypothetical protein